MGKYVIFETKQVMCVCLTETLVLKMSCDFNEKLQTGLFNIDH